MLLTPPDVASEEDDGPLTASKVAGLSLNAYAVILSARNAASASGRRKPRRFQVSPAPPFFEPVHVRSHHIAAVGVS